MILDVKELLTALSAVWASDAGCSDKDEHNINWFVCMDCVADGDTNPAIWCPVCTPDRVCHCRNDE